MVYCLNPHCPHPEADTDAEPISAGIAAESKVVRSANFCQSCGTPLTLIDKAQGDRYQLLSRLGQGGFGRTFLAERLPTDENRATIPCIIKQIYNNSLAGEAGFQTEAERLRKLGEHPQIPALLGWVENELGQFLIQTYAPGNNLAEQIEIEGTWTETQVRSLLKSLVPVLQYVHSFDIIHRDIKPANIVLATDKNLLPMLVDFGAAKWVRQSPAKTVIGSASYAAPEQSLGQATFASDIYSLGLTCLHALTGIHPFALFSAAENRWVWRDYLPQPIEPRFAQLLDQMVEPSLQQRYESMDQVSLDFQFSRNPLLHAPRQLFTRAKKSVAPLTNALQGQVTDKALPASEAIVTTPQHWQRQHRITQPIGLTKAIALSPRHQPSGPIFATAGTDGSVRLWHLPSGQLIHTFHRRRLMGNGHTAAITALRFHPDGRALYSASADGTIKEWDSAERCLLNTLTTSGWTPTALAITPDGMQLVSPYSDGQIVLWDIATLRPTAQLTQHQKSVNAVDISRRGNLLASASTDGTIKLWHYPRAPQGKGRPLLAKTINLNTPQSAKKIFGGQGLRQPEVIALALHTPPELPSPAKPAALRMPSLLTATAEGLIERYTLDEQLNPSAPAVVYQAPMPLTAFALSADGTLAIGTDDTLLTLWDIYTGECVAKLPHDWGVVAIAFSTDGQTLITASADEVISIWQRTAASQP